MSAVVFSGPTLSPREAARLFPEAQCLEPASQGDVWRACERRPRVICLIDGYFEHVPAVTHKELLWALHEGIVVMGAASMGALRAAELAPFGMQGHGEIYRAFVRGELEDDDEVAVAHADREHDFRPASDALVNLRATLARALAEGIVSEPTRDAIVRVAQRMFYAERTLQRALQECGVDPTLLAPLRSWARSNWVDQKRADACELLGHARRSQLPAQERPPFPHTDAWEQLVRENAARSSVDAQAILEELQLLGPDVFSELLFAATRRALCDELAHRSGGANPVELAHALSLAQLTTVLADLGDLERVHGRADRKRAALAGRAAQSASNEQVALYFTQRLNRPLPADLADYAAGVGFGSELALRHAIARELAFLRG
ncbi:MAG TPA: TfuA-like protein [Polyangiales bacterium]|nr:TfuA-like protein [Polyangiales bacterium]